MTMTDISANMMEKIWKESSGEITPRTFREFMLLGKRIDAAEGKARRRRAVMSALAIAASIAAVITVTFSLTRKEYEISPLDCTSNLVAEYGKQSSLTLEDGTIVHLNSGSTLLYPENFKGGSRIVYLTGEGNFAVAKDPSRPFIVKTAHLDVQALGTAFGVQAYAGDKTVRATLREGKVRVDVKTAGDKSYILEPGMQLVYTPSEKSVSVAMVDAGKVMSWENGYIFFSNASFPEIASVLERRFDISVSYNSENMRKSALNVRFSPDETLEDALDVLTLLIPGSRYKIEGKKVYFRF